MRQVSVAHMSPDHLWPAMLIGDLLENRARSTPEGVFWEQGGRAWRYSEINQAAHRVARTLRAEGLRPGEHAAIQALNGPAYLAAHFGAAKAGVVLAHLNTHYSATELHRLIDHSEARLVFLSPAQVESIDSIQAGLPRIRRWVLLPEGGWDDAPGAKELPCPPWAVDLAAWWDPPDADSAAGGGVSDGRDLDPESPFQLLYTSGTTGAPKGALISHRAKFRQGTTHALNLGLLPGDRLYSTLPLYHQFAQWLMLVSVPIAGATVVARPAFDAADCLAALADERISHLPAVPTMLYRLLDHSGGEIPFAPWLRCIVYGGAPVAGSRIPLLRKAFPNVRLFQGFGQTETGYCLGLHDGDHDRRPEALGRPDVFSEVRLVDERGRDVSDGQVGEIVARTPYLMQGYHRDPAATEAYFAFGGQWGRTGDLAVRDNEGYFTLVGRMDDMIISGGVNIHPAEIEQVLLQHPDVADAAVWGHPDEEWGEQVVATVIPREGANLAVETLETHCREALAGFKCPRRFLVLEAFPRTPSGKVQKHLLRDRLLTDPDQM